MDIQQIFWVTESEFRIRKIADPKKSQDAGSVSEIAPETQQIVLRGSHLGVVCQFLSDLAECGP